MRYFFVAAALVVAAIALRPRVVCASSTRCLAYRAAVRSDLRNVGTAQQQFQREHNRYAEALPELPDLAQSRGVTLTILASSETGLIVEGLHEKWPWGRCVMAAGSFANDSLPSGSPVCTGRIR